MSVAGKVVVVTGAGQGQGAAEARLLTTHGATVVGCDLQPEPVEDLGGAEYRQLDVTDAAGWTALADDLRREHGVVHGLVANAAITWRARLADLHPDDLSRVSQVNVTGTLLGIQALTPLMTAGGSARRPSCRGPARACERRGAGGSFRWPRSPAWNSARAASGSTPCTPATSRRR